jgi:hypothetical protein
VTSTLYDSSPTKSDSGYSFKVRLMIANCDPKPLVAPTSPTTPLVYIIKSGVASSPSVLTIPAWTQNAQYNCQYEESLEITPSTGSRLLIKLDSNNRKVSLSSIEPTPEVTFSETFTITSNLPDPLTNLVLSDSNYRFTAQI